MKKIYILNVDGGANSPEKQNLMCGLAREVRNALGMNAQRLEIEVLPGLDNMSDMLSAGSGDVYGIGLIGASALKVATDMSTQYPNVKFVAITCGVPKVDLDSLRRFAGTMRTEKKRKELII